ncbi:MAG: cysteine hydrolase [Fibrobacteres bacterium]|nr:cysteine hydrolase [Fibrobacterota bacterium]
MNIQVPADPYPWPYNGGLDPTTLAILVIDMQTDFCGKGGYIDSQGIDISATRRTIAPIRALLQEARRHPDILVIHTREGHRPELVDLPKIKRWRSKRVCPGIGEPGPCGRILVRGEPGWEIIPELAPAPGEIVVDKPGKGAFYATDLEHILRTSGREHLVLCGITTDVCVHTTLREAGDRGFDCMVLSDATGATQSEHHAAALTMTTMQGGIFGCVCESSELVRALEALP